MQLTAEQREAVREFQATSFSEYCKARGHDPNQKAAELLAHVRGTLEVYRRIAEPHKEKAADAYDQLLHLLSLDNYVAIRVADNEFRRSLYVDIIAAQAGSLPIQTEYVKSECERLSISGYDPGQPATVRHFLSAVPVLTSWDLQFNAFVNDSSPVADLPYICLNEILLSACDVYGQFVVPNTFIRTGDEARLRNQRQGTEFGSAPAFIDTMRKCIMLLLGDGGDFPYTKPNTLSVPESAAIMQGFLRFVWFHEIGHLLQGHLVQHSSHAREFEADAFAWKVIETEGMSRPDGHFLWIGTLTALAILDLFDVLSNGPESQSHPYGRRRIKAVLDAMRKAEGDLVRVATSYLRAFAAICNPTLDKHWKRQLNYSTL